MIRILIADDHLIVRTGLAALLGTEKDMEVVGQAKNGIEAVREAVRLKPDIVIMDLMMPKMDGVAATAEIAAKSPETRVILLTTFGTSDGRAHALANGAKGAILKNADNAELARAIRKLKVMTRVMNTASSWASAATAMVRPSGDSAAVWT